MIRQKQTTRTSYPSTLRLHLSARGVFLFLLFLLFQSSLSAQQWEQFITLGDTTNYANGMVQTAQGEIFVAGHTGDGASSDQIFLIKLDKYGNELFQNVFGTNTYDEVRSVITTIDGGVIMGGFTYDMPMSGNGQGYLVKADADGNIEWQQEYGGDGFDRIHSIVQSDDGGYLLGCWTTSNISGDVTQAPIGGRDFWLVKVDATGNIQWDRRYGGTEDEELYDLDIATNGDYIAIGLTESAANGPSDVYVVRIDQDGNDVWDYTYGNIDGDHGFSIDATDDNGCAIGGVTFNPSNGDSDMYLLKLNDLGVEEWSTPLGGTLGEWGGYVVALNNGGYAISGSTRSYGSDSLDIMLIFTDATGSQTSQKVYEGGGNEDNVNAMTQAVDDGFLIAAQSRSLEAFPEVTSELYLLKTGPDGATLTTNIEGSVYWDTDGDCIEGVAEAALEDWLVVIKSIDRTFYATTDINGDYNAYIDTGSYTISIITPNQYWDGVCGLNQNLIVDSYYDTISNVDFALEAVTNCFYLEADISTALLRPCEDATYTVKYSNTGTVAGFGTFLEIELDDDFILNSVSQPYTLTGNQLIVGVGTVAPGITDSFQINVYLDCVNAIEGETHKMGLNMVPNLICTPPSGWDNSSLSVDAVCENDSVKFTITNDGAGGMSEVSHYIIVIDDLIAKTDVVQLASGDNITITEPAEGTTIRLETPQAENHPGRSMPTQTIEGCGVNMSGGISLGFVNQFAEDDANSHRSDDAQESLSNGLPSMIRAFPKGHQDENYIKPNLDIEYHILCQNTTSDTIENIVIENKIPDELDITSLQPGASSHDYDFEITGERLLRFTFNGVQLPDSTSNEIQSQIFVKFRISQNEDLPAETEIYNQASILMGNQVKLTDSILHTVEKEVLYNTYVQELCEGIVWNDQFSIEADTLILDTFYFPQHDLVEIIDILALPNSFTVIDTTIQLGIAYNGIIYDQDTSFVELYSAYNTCDSMVTTNILVETTSINELEHISALEVFPNPNNGHLTLQYTLIESSEFSFEIKEMSTGKVILKEAPALTLAGEHLKQINLKEVPAGAYMIKIKVENDLVIQKLIKL